MDEILKEFMQDNTQLGKALENMAEEIAALREDVKYYQTENNKLLRENVSLDMSLYNASLSLCTKWWNTLKSYLS